MFLRMKKYRSVFDISLAQEFAYRANFIMWRVRNVVQMLLIYFLWDNIFANREGNIFGYSRSSVTVYIFGVLILKSFIFSSRSVDVAGEIAQGNLTNYLLKPLNYFYYWFTRDISAKLLNLFFGLLEAAILYLVLKPEISFHLNIFNSAAFLAAVAVAVVLYFLLLMLVNAFPFWYPQQAGGLQFLLFIFADLFGGGIFPIDILPEVTQKIFYITPFPYLLFFPLQIFLGKIPLNIIFISFLVSLIWVAILIFLLKNVWRMGIKSYRAEGR